MKAQRNSSLETGTEHSFRRWLLLDLAASFMLAVFAPLEAFFSNEEEYWFDLSHLLPVVLTTFVISFLLLALLSLMADRAKWRDSLYTLGLFLLVFLYVQGNYIPRPYGVLDGAAIDWGKKQFRPLAMASVALALCCLLAWVLSIVQVRVRKFFRSYGGVICGFLIGVQLATLGALYVGNEVLGGVSHSSCAVSSEKLFELSCTNNVLFLLLDTFDAKYMNKLLEEREADVREVLQDFTYYPDTAGLYPTTRGSLPHLLTGVIYTNEMPHAEYVQKAFANNPLLASYSEKHFSACAYTDSSYISAENPVFENVHRLRFRIQNVPAFAGKLYKLVAFNYLPHQLKRHFLVYGSDFSPFRKLDRGIPPYSLEVLDFYHELQKTDVSTAATNGVFRFYHTEGVHPPHTFGEELDNTLKKKYTWYDASLGCLTLVKCFLNKLRESGAYDTSTIVILADHGDVLYRQNPLFLVKNRNERHPFQTSDVPFSYCNLKDVIEALIREESAITPDFLSMLAPRNGERKFYFYRWGERMDRRFLPDMDAMLLTGSAALTNGGHIKKVGTIAGGKVIRRVAQYILGTPLYFSRAGARGFKPYVVSGLHVIQGDYTWTHDHEVILRMKVEGDFKDLLLELDCGTYNGKQRVFASANGHSIGSTTTYGRSVLGFSIPRTCIGKDGILTIRLELPDAITPEEVKHNGDVRLLALQFFSLQISAKEKVLHCERGKRLSFAQADGAPALRHCLHGMSHADKAFTWTQDNSVRMEFNTEGWTPESFTLRYKTFLPKERVILRVGKREIANFEAQGTKTKKFSLPKGCVEAGDSLTITLELPDAISPSELKGAKDKRRLALALYSMTLE